jgi:hypothetical protein
VTRADDTVDRAADRLQDAADKAGDQGGLRGKLAHELADDAAFLRKLKPSLIRARLRGDAPTNGPAGEGVVAPRGPQLGKRPRPPGAGGPNPYVVVAVAFAAGIVLAKLIDWRSHAHPRD